MKKETIMDRRSTTIRNEKKLEYENVEFSNDEFENGLKKLLNVINASQQKEKIYEEYKKGSFGRIKPLYSNLFFKYGILGALLLTLVIVPTVVKKGKDQYLNTTLTRNIESIQKNRGNIQLNTQVNASVAKELIKEQIREISKTSGIFYYKESWENELNGQKYYKSYELIKDKESPRYSIKTTWKEPNVDKRVKFNLFDGKVNYDYWNDTYINTLQETTYKTGDGSICENQNLKLAGDEGEGNPILDKFNEILNTGVFELNVSSAEEYKLEYDESGINGTRYHIIHYFTKSDFRYIRSEMEFYNENRLLSKSITTVDDYGTIERTKENLDHLFRFDEVVDKSFEVVKKTKDCF